MAAIVPVRAQTAITTPIDIPLYSTTIDTGQQKLGIYVSVGGGTPELFEFDTGGSGLYTSYASENTANSPWVGSGVSQSTISANNSYDSGLVYAGVAATASVSLFQSPGASAPLVSTAPSVAVGLISSITNSNSSVTLWTGSGNAGTVPPVNGAFYGDFGMGLKYSSNSIVNVIAQLSYGNGMIPGYIINASGPSPYLQIGLTAQEVSDPSTLLFPMTVDPSASGSTFPGSNSNYYAGQVINAVLNLSGSGGTAYTSGSNIPIDLDTGASTTIHNFPDTDQTSPFISDDDSDLDSNVNFSLSGTTLSGTTATFFNFETTDTVDAGNVALQSDSKYYLNTGISIFNDYGVMYDLRDGALGLIAVPEPNPAVLAFLGAGIAVCTSVLLHRKRPLSADIS